MWYISKSETRWFMATRVHVDYKFAYWTNCYKNVTNIWEYERNDDNHNFAMALVLMGGADMYIWGIFPFVGKILKNRVSLYENLLCDRNKSNPSSYEIKHCTFRYVRRGSLNFWGFFWCPRAETQTDLKRKIKDKHDANRLTPTRKLHNDKHRNWKKN